MATASLSPAQQLEGKSKRAICELIQASAPASFLASHKLTSVAKNCVKRIRKARLIEIYEEWQQSLAEKTVLEIERPTKAVESRIVDEAAAYSKVPTEAQQVVHPIVDLVANSQGGNTKMQIKTQTQTKTQTKTKAKIAAAIATNVSVSRHAEFFLAEQKKQRPNPAMVAAARGQARVASRLTKLQRNSTISSSDGSATAVDSVNAELGVVALCRGHVISRARVAEREIEAQKCVGNSAKKALEARREIQSAKAAGSDPASAADESPAVGSGGIDVGAGPCAEYRIDLTGTEFGICKCGFSKVEHGTKKLPSWAKKGSVSRSSTRVVCPPCP